MRVGLLCRNFSRGTDEEVPSSPAGLTTVKVIEIHFAGVGGAVGTLDSVRLVIFAPWRAAGRPACLMSTPAVAVATGKDSVCEGMKRMGSDALQGLIDEALKQLAGGHLGALSRTVRRSLLDPRRVGMVGTAGEERQKLIAVLFSSLDSSDFASRARATRLRLEHVSEFIVDEGLFALVDAMLDRPAEYRVQLGVIFTFLSLDCVPPALVEKLAPIMPGSNFSVQAAYGDWALCETSEERLADAIDDEAIVVVENEGHGYLDVKFNGKVVGLCFENTKTRNGAFVKGNWYSPLEGRDDIRTAVLKAFCAGQGRLV